MTKIFTNQTIIELDSGRVEVADNTWTAVAFNFTFGGIPIVVCTIEDEVGIIENLSVKNISTTGFEVHQELKTAATKFIQWIAVNGG